jgi:hypothetical protein
MVMKLPRVAWLAVELASRKPKAAWWIELRGVAPGEFPESITGVYCVYARTMHGAIIAAERQSKLLMPYTILSVRRRARP